ncbi:MAG: Rrf2 family transcriptional regulator [Acidobacteriota bacterium]
MMMYRRSAQLALQATPWLALRPESSSRRVREWAEELGVATTYVSKIGQKLTRVGLLLGVRGPGGGVELPRYPGEIHPWDVLSGVEPVGGFERCLLRPVPCHQVNPCPVHGVWALTRNRILDIPQTNSLGEFTTEAQRRGLLSREPTPSTHSGARSSCSEAKHEVVSDEA